MLFSQESFFKTLRRFLAYEYLLIISTFNLMILDTSHNQFRLLFLDQLYDLCNKLLRIILKSTKLAE